MSNHSPGPWYALAEGIADNAIGYRAIFDSDGDTVCNPSPMGEANARLIAAAPDLLAALQTIVENQGNLFPIDWANARDAVAKATGEAA